MFENNNVNYEPIFARSFVCFWMDGILQREREREREREEFSQYQKLWDFLYFREKVNRRDTQLVQTSFKNNVSFIKMLDGCV